MCYVIELPFILISDLIFIVKFTPNVVYTVLLFSLSFIIILLSACIGLIINLKYPKMNASSDTEVIKQSTSSLISTFLGMVIFILSTALILGLGSIMKTNLVIIIIQISLFIITMVLYTVLMKVGTKKYKNINA